MGMRCKLSKFIYLFIFLGGAFEFKVHSQQHYCQLLQQYSNWGTSMMRMVCAQQSIGTTYSYRTCPSFHTSRVGDIQRTACHLLHRVVPFIWRSFHILIQPSMHPPLELLFPFLIFPRFFEQSNECVTCHSHMPDCILILIQIIGTCKL